MGWPSSQLCIWLHNVSNVAAPRVFPCHSMFRSNSSGIRNASGWPHWPITFCPLQAIAVVYWYQWLQAALYAVHVWPEECSCNTSQELYIQFALCCVLLFVLRHWYQYIHPHPSRLFHLQWICQWTRSSMVQIMACRLFDAKPFSEPMLGNYWLDPCKPISVKLYISFH